MNPQDVLQTTNRWKAFVAHRDVAGQRLEGRRRPALRRAALSKARVDVRVAEADLNVAKSEERRLQPGSTISYCPRPSTASSWPATPILSTSCCRPRVTPRPIATARTYHQAARRPDLRGRPHRHHPHLRRHPRDSMPTTSNRFQGHRARQGIRERPIPGTVIRTSWTYVQSRTLRAESTCPTPAAGSCRGCMLSPR